MGALTPYGAGVPSLWEGLLAAVPAVAPIRSFDASDLDPGRAAAVSIPIDDDDRAGGMLLVAADEARRQAGIAHGMVPAARIGVAVGTTLAGMAIFEAWLGRSTSQARPCRAEELKRIPYFAPAVRLATHLGAQGPISTTQLACASGTAAVAVAAAWIRGGRCDVAFAGGTDLLCRYVVAGFNALRATADEARPFDVGRRGLVLGEGAAVLVLESRARASARRAVPLARVTGSGAAADAVHMTAPDRTGAGAAHAIEMALHRAGRAPADVAFVSAHGTGTRYNDAMEARALESVFGPHGVPVNSIKGAVGHTLGAAGAIEAVLCVEVARRGVVPPTAGLTEVAPECAALDLVVESARSIRSGPCVSTSSGFAGANAAIVVEPA